MKPALTHAVATTLGIAAGLTGSLATPRPATPPPTLSAHFSPKGGCTQVIVDSLLSARESVHVQAYQLTSLPVGNALIAAHQRGVVVKVILDKGQLHEDDSQLPALAAAGVSVWIDHAHAIAHDKVILIDGEVLLTGSFNFSRGAEERNAENLLRVQDRAMAARYLENWLKHQKHAHTYPEAPQ